MPPRAPALSPDDRRASIVTAAVGILRVKGQAATTREIAEAAGVAEGTLFRVFRTKDDLFAAVMVHAFDPTPVLRSLDQIDLGLPLRERLIAAVGGIQNRYLEAFELLHALGLVRPPDHPGGGPEARPEAESWVQQVDDRLGALVAPDTERLAVPVDQLVELVGLLTFAGSHPILTRGRILSPETIVEVLLNGTQKGARC